MKTKKNILRSIMAVLLVMALMMPMSAFAVGDDDDGGDSTEEQQTSNDSPAPAPTQEVKPFDEVEYLNSFEKVAENDRLVLKANMDKGWVIVEDKTTGAVWDSNPREYEQDPIAQPVAKNRNASLTLIERMDKQRATHDHNSFTDSYKKKGTTVKKITNGIRVDMKYVMPQITIPMEIVIDGDALVAKVLTSEINQEDIEKARLNTISVLPGFGAGNKADEGYLFIPDGSGSLIRFNNAQPGQYTKQVYGLDKAKVIKSVSSMDYDVNLPVFGIEKNGQGFLGVITSGESRAYIDARADDSSSYRTVCSKFIFQKEDSVRVNSKDWDAKSVRVYEPKVATTDFEVKYFFLDKDKADYTGMAQRYQKYLLEDEGVQVTAKADYAPLYMDAFGGLRRTEVVLGFPIKKVVGITKYSDLTNMVKTLKDEGVNDLVVNYLYWTQNGTQAVIPSKADVSGALGGKKDYEKMTSYLKENNVPLYLDLDMVEMESNKNGYNTKRDSIRAIDQTPTILSSFIVINGEPDTLLRSMYLLNPTKLAGATDKTISSINKHKLDQTGYSLNTLGQYLYSNYSSKSYVDRVDAQQNVEDSIKSFHNSGSTMFSTANAYTFKYADNITDAPMHSSQYNLSKEEVPFYQIALHGIIPMSVEAINRTGDEKNAVLKAVETGTNLKYVFGSKNLDRFRETEFEDYHDIDFSLWYEDAVESYKKTSDYLKSVSDQKITKHEFVSEEVTKTTYENGVTAIVNYSKNDVQVDGQTVKAQDFIVVGGNK